MEASTFGSVTVRPGNRAVGQLSVGELDQLSFARGNIDLPLMVARGRRDGPTLLLLAGQHAGEYVGMETIIRLLREVDLDSLAGTLVGIPVMNTFGFVQKVPYVCPLDNLNMNRLWPGVAGGTVGQRITYAVWHEVLSKADYLMDLHGGDFPEHQADYAIAMVTGNAEIDAVSDAMARHFLLPLIRRSPPSEGAAPTGPSARMAMKLLGKPSIVPELGDGGILDADRLANALRGVTNVMKYLDMLPGEPEPPPAGQRAMISRTAVRASVHGFCRLKATIYDEVAKDQVIAEVVDYFGEPIETLRSPVDGMVVQTFFQSATNPGNIVAKIARLESAAQGSTK